MSSHGGPSFSVPSRDNPRVDGCGNINANVNTNASRKRKKPGAGKLQYKLQLHTLRYALCTPMCYVYIYVTYMGKAHVGMFSILTSQSSGDIYLG